MYIGFILGSWAEEEISLLLSVFWFGRLKNSFSYLFKTLLCCSTDRYPVCDDDDDSDMEANWEQIMKEEKRRLVKFPKSHFFGKLLWKHLYVENCLIPLLVFTQC